MRATVVAVFAAWVVPGLGACGNCIDDDHVLAEPGPMAPAEVGDEVPVEPGPTPAGIAVGDELPVEPRIARLTGGVGNRVVDSFDQIRAGVRDIQRPIDDCYAMTAGEGGWRENLLWDLEVGSDGSVTRVTPHRAEYWRGNRIVEALPSPLLGGCMEGVLHRLVLPAPVRAGWIRVRFEPV